MSFPETELLALTGAPAVASSSLVQPLWGRYGGLYRVALRGEHPGVVAKWIVPPADQPGLGHRRKLRSYQVELSWYRQYANLCPGACRVPNYIGDASAQAGTLLVMEDLAESGFRPAEQMPVKLALPVLVEWLAAFHATFMGQPAAGLWGTGCYWHLATRPDEWQAMPAGPLKRSADAIDARLAAAQFQTLVHGDAKLANFCMSDCGEAAAVDFQYVGRGPGVRDLAYLLGSMLNDEQLERSALEWLEHYQRCLQRQLRDSGNWSPSQLARLHREQSELFPFAWADFERFLLGWKPGHWKLGSFSARQTELALARL